MSSKSARIGPRADIEIRIRPDGRVYLSSLPEELLDVAAALDPRNDSLARRERLLPRARRDREQAEPSKEPLHGDVAADS